MHDDHMDDCNEKIGEDLEPCQHNYSDFSALMAMCGCGERHIRTYRDEDIYHFHGRHWSSHCLLKHLVSVIDSVGWPA